ncbi:MULTISPECIES: FAD-dependent oxidoreductase [Prauserella salsuginis group]|uniref:FAD-dependent oxidoreductase n=1 Tax=Prauserella salsuginis TaxID=387889 RepID=A0ABW6FZN5_9PSEU|nr:MULTISPECIES: FAD-dependent oxidoreductase [Prauserella salsuginis group]MCR3720976.1 FAD binding domain-containing protein [Prauserella flava]MCR3734943.1 FAD binding domain-containing protein [Prauserella salsuginis]
MAEFDVVVLGTGAAGLTAALSAADTGASVGLFEKSSLIGGTTCLSSGVAWLPDNRYAREAGVEDSRAEGVRYLESLSRGMIRPGMAEAFVDGSGEVTDWLETRTPLHLSLVPGYPDYHPEHPGGKPKGGRSVEPELFPFDELGAWADHIEGRVRRMMVRETPVGGGTGVVDPGEANRREQLHLEGLGRAMVGALLKGCLDHGIEPVTGAAAVELIQDGHAVSGARFADGSTATARHGVVIATGGFEWDADLVRDFLRGPMSYPATVPTNTGDGLRMAMKAGARLGNMREAWWVPVCVLPGQENHGEQAVHLVLRERTLPRSIMVNRAGERFTNEAANYNALGGAFHQLDPSDFDYLGDPCWLIFDARHVEEYGGFTLPPGQAPDWALRADTIGELARKIDVEPATLGRTVDRFNGMAADGVDTDFARGVSAYDGFVGDKRYYPAAASTLGPLDEGPYYAVRLHISTLGTKGGPQTDVDGSVFTVDGDPIPGLFAAGNAMAGPTGMVYGGAGGTLGPALVFGYRAGRAAASGGKR